MRLTPMLEGFARTQKFLLGDRIQAGALAVHVCLIEAAYTRALCHTIFAGGWFDPLWADGRPTEGAVRL